MKQTAVPQAHAISNRDEKPGARATYVLNDYPQHWYIAHPTSQYIATRAWSLGFPMSKGVVRGLLMTDFWVAIA